MTGRIIGMGLAVCTIASAGCGGVNHTYSCSQAAAAVCVEWTSVVPLTGAQLTQLQQGCGAEGGVFGNGSACPTANRVGVCALPNSTGIPGLTYKVQYYSPLYNASTGQMICAGQNGSWTPG